MRPSETEWADAGAEAEQAVGTGRRVVVGGRGVALFRTDRGYSAFEDRCPHAGAPLSAAAVRDGRIVCSWHGWAFDAETGACRLFDGAPSAVPVPVRVEGGRVRIACRPV